LNIDPRTKLFSFIVLFILVIAARDLLDFSVLSLAVLALLVAGGGSLNRLLIRIVGLAWLILLIAYFGFVSPAAAPAGWAPALAAVWRLALLVALALAVTSWFSPHDLIAVISTLNRKPGRLTGFINRITLAAGLAWRMLPEIMTETRRIFLVRKLQGLFPGRLSYLNPATWLMILAPAVRRTMVRARRTGFALAVRGFDPDAPRSSMIALRLGRTDLTTVIFIGALTTIIIV
jgi:energy-coupling factor transporter transmembrane protein EcfT